MTTIKLRNLVTEAVALDREINDAQSRLDDIKEQLKAEAGTRPEEHTPTELGGWSWVADGSDGCVARVTQEGPKLKASISSDKDIAVAKDIAGPCFGMLFEPRVTFKLSEGFRDRAASALGTAAAKLIRKLSGKGQVKVSFETKEAA